MAENTFKEPQKEKSDQNKKDSKFQAGLHSLLDGSFLAKKHSSELLPFLAFLTLMAIALIANTYYAEKKTRETESMRRELTELRTQYISNKAELMHLSNQSEIAKKLKPYGFVESTVPPGIIMEPRRRNIFMLRIFNRN